MCVFVALIFHISNYLCENCFLSPVTQVLVYKKFYKTCQFVTSTFISILLLNMFISFATIFHQLRMTQKTRIVCWNKRQVNKKSSCTHAQHLETLRAIFSVLRIATVHFYCSFVYCQYLNVHFLFIFSWKKNKELPDDLPQWALCLHRFVCLSLSLTLFTCTFYLKTSLADDFLDGYHNHRVCCYFKLPSVWERSLVFLILSLSTAFTYLNDSLSLSVCVLFVVHAWDRLWR